MNGLKGEGRYEVWIVWIIGIWNPVGTLNYVSRKLRRLFHSDVMLWLISHPLELGICMFCSCFIWLSWGPRNTTKSPKQIKILKILSGLHPKSRWGTYIAPRPPADSGSLRSPLLASLPSKYDRPLSSLTMPRFHANPGYATYADLKNVHIHWPSSCTLNELLHFKGQICHLWREMPNLAKFGLCNAIAYQTYIYPAQGDDL